MKTARRLDLVDFLRGIAILEMVVAHFARYFPPTVGKTIGYSETAMALFVLLAGFVVGWQQPQFEREPRAQTLGLWNRALRVYIAQALLILAVGLPLHLAGVPLHDGQFDSGQFLWRSFTFQNQIGLLHILPTFIPLFLVSPLILLCLWHGAAALLLAASVALFAWGVWSPHALDVGDPTIFPFLLFQAYFVAGCLIGYGAQRAGTLTPRHAARLAMISLAWLLMVIAVVHGHVVPPGSLRFHPLNLTGFVYHVSILAALWLGCTALWPRIQSHALTAVVLRFGRHALLTFVLHVIFAKGLEAAHDFAVLPRWVDYLVVFGSLPLTWMILVAYERRVRTTAPPLWARGVRYLFR
jgi:hypothetical protein